MNHLLYEWDCAVLIREHPLFLEAVTRCIGMHKYACESADHTEADSDFLTPPTQLSDREMASLSEEQLELQTNCLLLATNMVVDGQNHDIDDL